MNYIYGVFAVRDVWVSLKDLVTPHNLVSSKQEIMHFYVILFVFTKNEKQIIYDLCRCLDPLKPGIKTNIFYMFLLWKELPSLPQPVMSLGFLSWFGVLIIN